MDLLTTDNSANWVPGWWPFHTKLLVFSSRADYQLNSHSQTSYFTSLHSTELQATDCSRVKVTLQLTASHSVGIGVEPRLRLMTIFYCLRFETSLFVASYNSQGHGGGIRPSLPTSSAGVLVI
jgi:hypothetical protein